MAYTKTADGRIVDEAGGLIAGAPDSSGVYSNVKNASGQVLTGLDKEGNLQFAYPAGSPSAGITADNGTARTDEKLLSESLRSSILRGPQDTTYIDNYISALDKRRADTERGINESFDAVKTATGEQQRKEVGSTSAVIARAGGYLGESGSGQGVLLNLAQTHKAEMQGIEAKRQQALAEARAAYEDKQFAAAKLKVEEARTYEKESFERQKEYFNTIKTETDKLKERERIMGVNKDIYNAIAGGAKNETEIFGKLGGKVSPEDIKNFFTNLKPKTAATAIYKFNNDDVGKLLHAGITPDEMQLFTDDLNKYGYAKAVEGLTGSQRAVVDELLNGKKTGGITNGLTIAEAKSLGLPPELIGMDERQFVRDLSSPTPPQWFVQHTEQTYQQNLLPDKTQKLWETFKKTVEDKFKGKSGLEFDSISSDPATGVSFDSIPSATPQPAENTDGEEKP